MRYCSSQAEWMYKQVEIDQLPVISHELAKLLKVIQVKHRVLLKNKLFSSWDIELIHAHAPMLIAWLTEHKLIQYFIGVFFTVCDSNTRLSIHIDAEEGTDISGTKINLLIPVSNCKNSWTVWHDADTIDQGLSELHGTNNYGRICDPATAVEVSKIETIVPYWLNPTIPHQPVTGELEHAGPRIAASLRFTNDILLDEKCKSYYMP
jgi:hypothetical protein